MLSDSPSHIFPTWNWRFRGVPNFSKNILTAKGETFCLAKAIVGWQLGSACDVGHKCSYFSLYPQQSPNQCALWLENMAARDTWQKTAMGLRDSCPTVDNQVSCVLHSASPGVPSEKTQRLKLTTPDPSVPCLSLHCLGEGSSVDTQAAYTDQMGHVTSPRVNDGLPERLALSCQSHSMGTDGWLSHRPL